MDKWLVSMMIQVEVIECQAQMEPFNLEQLNVIVAAQQTDP